MATKTLMTIDQFLAYPSDARCELICGEVIEMSPPGFRHGIVCLNVAMILKRWVATNHIRGRVAVNDTGVITQRDPATVRGADCIFIREDRIPADYDQRGFLTVPPDLIAEVLSPTDRWSEVIAKVGDYLEMGVHEVWIVDPELLQVEVFRPDSSPRTYRATDELTSEDVLPGFRCRISDFFEERCAEAA